MIYTVTINPAIDLFVEADIVLGETNRVSKEEYTTGGKGINVSIVCSELGNKTTAIGFVNGFTGEFIKNELSKRGIGYNFISCDGITRVNMKIVGIQETEINLNGVSIPENSYKEMKEYLNSNLKNKDFLIISGNSTKGMGKEEYLEIANIANAKGATLVVDTNQAYLEYLLSEKPFLVKPNIQELAGMFSGRMSAEEQIIQSAKKLQSMGAENVLVNNGTKGTILVTSDAIYFADALDEKIVSSTGISDSMVAGFVCEWKKTNCFESALRMSVASGEATANSATLAKKKEILKIIEQVNVIKRVL